MSTRTRALAVGALLSLAAGAAACLPPPPPFFWGPRHDERAERRDRWERGHWDRDDRRERRRDRHERWH